MTSTSTTAAVLVAQAKERVEELSPAQVAEEIASGQALLVDLREPNESAVNGCIPGAVAAPRGMLEFWADPASPYHRPEFDPARRIILHCASGGRSALAAQSLEQLGYTQIAHLAGGFKSWKEAGRPVTRGPARELLAKWAEAFNQHDVAAFGACYSLGAQVSDPMYPTPLEGVDAVRDDMESFFRAFPDIHAEIGEVLVDGDRVVCQCTVTGTHKGPLASPEGELPATGNPLSFDVAVLFRLDEKHQIVEERRYFDLANFMRQLGIA